MVIFFFPNKWYPLSLDHDDGGYYETDGKLIASTPEWPFTSDVGDKDQNSSIHIPEAFTTLYEVWPDEVLKEA
ncbi:hypothetical protein V5739_11640 [Salinimicrobium sp. TIG7-5_MAKvit]|uniref:hypothetical protein n=1 Tax=Salinimicrobium sp. TIG7-5_MAKvit TaxID=3121289 RepID=UPI003C6E962A